LHPVATVRAAFYEGKGRVRIGPCAPLAPGPEEVQIQVSHVGLCGSDLHLFHGHLDHRVRPPHVLGHEMSGVLAAVGEAVAGWRPGDRVTARPLDSCGSCPTCRAGNPHVCDRLKVLGIDAPGAMRGLWTVPARILHRLPEALPFELGALVEPLAVACHDVRLAEVRPGEHVLVQGGGPIGALIALVAREAGAHALVSEVNPFRLALARRLGLEAADPRELDLDRLVRERTGGAGADVVFEVSGSAAGALSMTGLARARGRVVVVALFPEPPRVDLLRVFLRELRLVGARVYEEQDFERSIALAASGRLPLGALVTKVLPLEGLESAFREMEGGGEVMKVLIRQDAP
jgi:2-desacetyl-2-hydroxyethyl bacteriochlorophyllide A dehydrogenase